MNKQVDKTSVTIVGTFHGSMLGMNLYSPDKLRELIQSSQPEVLAIEIRPEDHHVGCTHNNPWDMNEVVIPFANQANIPIEPIDWWPDNLRVLYNEAIDSLRKTVDGNKVLSEFDDEWAVHAVDFPDYKEVTPEYVHSNLFAQRETDYRLRIKSKLGEGPQNLMWYTRADVINKNLASVLKKHSGKRITVVVGASHRPDIERFLKTQNEIDIQPLIR